MWPTDGHEEAIMKAQVAGGDDLRLEVQLVGDRRDQVDVEPAVAEG